MLAARGRCMVTQVLPLRKRMWSLSMRSSVHGPVSAAAFAIWRSTVVGKRPWNGDCSAKLGGATDERAARDRCKFHVGAVGISVWFCTSVGPLGSIGADMVMPAEGDVTVTVWAGRRSAGVLASRTGGLCVLSPDGSLVSSVLSGGSHTAMDGSRASLRTHCMPRSAVHHSSTPARCRPSTTRPTLAWLARRFTPMLVLAQAWKRACDAQHRKFYCG